MTLAPLAASLVTQSWIGRELRTVGLGEYHATSLFVTVVTTVLFFGYPTAVAQRLAMLDEQNDEREGAAIDTALTLAVLFGIGIAAVGALAWIPFTVVFGLRVDLPVVFVAAALLMSAIAGVAANALLAKLKVRLTSIIILAQPAGVALAIGSSYLGLPLRGADLALVGFIASGAVGLIVLVSQGVRPRFDRAEAPRLLVSSLPATFWTYPSLVTGWVDRAIIGIILGPAALGAFVAASTLTEALQRLTRGLTTLGVPAYARLATDEVGSRRVLDSHLRLMLGAFIVAGAFFIAAGSGVLSLLFGEGFAIATTTLRLLSIALLPLGVAIVLASHGIGSDPSRSAGRILALLIATHVIVGSVMTSIFHIAGTGFANLIVWGLGALLYLSDAKRRGTPLDPRTLLHTAGIGVPLFMASWIIGTTSLDWPVRGAIALIPSLGLVTLVLIGEPERRLLKRLISTSRAPAHRARSS